MTAIQNHLICCAGSVIRILSKGRLSKPVGAPACPPSFMNLLQVPKRRTLLLLQHNISLSWNDQEPWGRREERLKTEWEDQGLTGPLRQISSENLWCQLQEIILWSNTPLCINSGAICKNVRREHSSQPLKIAFHTFVWVERASLWAGSIYRMDHTRPWYTYTSHMKEHWPWVGSQSPATHDLTPHLHSLVESGQDWTTC